MVSECEGSPTNLRAVATKWTDCVGTYTTSRGRRFAGEWLDGQLHGPGTAVFANGNKYVGEWRHGKKHGQGTQTFVRPSKRFSQFFQKGSKYVGEWRDGKRHGIGVGTKSNGDKYVGKWRKQRLHGQGTYTYADGSVKKGTWKNGKFQNAKKPSSQPSALARIEATIKSLQAKQVLAQEECSSGEQDACGRSEDLQQHVRDLQKKMERVAKTELLTATYLEQSRHLHVWPDQTFKTPGSSTGFRLDLATLTYFGREKRIYTGGAKSGESVIPDEGREYLKNIFPLRSGKKWSYSLTGEGISNDGFINQYRHRMSGEVTEKLVRTDPVIGPIYCFRINYKLGLENIWGTDTIDQGLSTLCPVYGFTEKHLEVVAGGLGIDDAFNFSRTKLRPVFVDTSGPEVSLKKTVLASFIQHFSSARRFASRKAEKERRRLAVAEPKRLADKKREAEIARAEKARLVAERRLAVAETQRLAEKKWKAEIARVEKARLLAERRLAVAEEKRLAIAEAKRKATAERRLAVAETQRLAEKKWKAEIARVEKARLLAERRLAVAEEKRLAEEKRQAEMVRAEKTRLLAERRLAVAAKKTNPFTGMHFGSYHALVIGNNRYRHLQHLKSARNDATSVTRLLSDQYGFRVSKLTDATRSDILGALARYRATLKPDDNLLIYYAGHGVVDNVTKQGFWLPVDAEEQNPTNWVSNSDLTGMLRAIRARHVMVVADSCYSGTLVRATSAQMATRQDKVAWVKRMLRKRGRTALVSGGLEPVSDSGVGGEHSVFAEAFMSALRGNNDVMDGRALFDAIKRPVVLNADQTPQYSNIRYAGHEGGEFMFVRKTVR
ncbi:caspase family protein [Alphaproteobacteria bacterium]|nr:caspase family protein [Alphaproteobacteria bacterium]